MSTHQLSLERPHILARQDSGRLYVLRLVINARSQEHMQMTARVCVAPAHLRKSSGSVGMTASSTRGGTGMTGEAARKLCSSLATAGCSSGLLGVSAVRATKPSASVPCNTTPDPQCQSSGFVR